MNRTDFIYTDTYFPELTMPVNFKTGDTLLFFESKQIYWKISTILKNKNLLLDYQLAFFTPGIKPFDAISRN